MRRFASRLRSDRRGLALLEFAFTLPIVLVMITWGIELANYGIAILKIHQIAATASDNAARVRNSISEGDVNEVIEGAKVVGQGLEFATRGRVIISDVVPNGLTGTNEGQKINWQRCGGALNDPASQPKYGTQGTGTTNGTLKYMGTATKNIAASTGSAMIFVEVTYKYKPIVPFSFIKEQILRSESSFTVRERSSETLGTGTPSSVCTRYDL